MKNKLFALLISAVLVLVCATFASASISFTIEAYIDGRDQLIINDNTLQWHHFDWDPAGTTKIWWTDGTETENFTWNPTWSGDHSDVYTAGHIFVPNEDMDITFTAIQARESAFIAQDPTEDNGWELIIEFDDNAPSGADWYKVKVELTPSAVPIPGAVWLLGSGLVGFIGVRRKASKS